MTNIVRFLSLAILIIIFKITYEKQNNSILKPIFLTLTAKYHSLNFKKRLNLIFLFILSYRIILLLIFVIPLQYIKMGKRIEEVYRMAF